MDLFFSGPSIKCFIYLKSIFLPKMAAHIDHKTIISCPECHEMIEFVMLKGHKSKCSGSNKVINHQKREIMNLKAMVGKSHQNLLHLQDQIKVNKNLQSQLEQMTIRIMELEQENAALELKMHLRDLITGQDK